MCKIISDEALKKRSGDDQRRRSRKGIPSAREQFCEFSFGIDLSARGSVWELHRRIEATTTRIFRNIRRRPKPCFIEHLIAPTVSGSGSYSARVHRAFLTTCLGTVLTQCTMNDVLNWYNYGIGIQTVGRYSDDVIGFRRDVRAPRNASLGNRPHVAHKTLY